MEEARPFTLLVSLVGERPQKFTFDQARVMVGRGADADLRIEHAAISRAQFLLERGVGSVGEPRFRITPYETTNPTLVNDRPAVEGTIMPGDLVAIGDVRLILERKIQKAQAQEKKADIPPMRMVLLGATTLMALVVGFDALGLPALHGRLPPLVAWPDRGPAAVGVANQAFLDSCRLGDRPLGEVSGVGPAETTVDIAGIIDNALTRGIRQAPGPAVYVPLQLVASAMRPAAGWPKTPAVRCCSACR